jgi:hypothetical protein
VSDVSGKHTSGRNVAPLRVAAPRRRDATSRNTIACCVCGGDTEDVHFADGSNRLPLCEDCWRAASVERQRREWELHCVLGGDEPFEPQTHVPVTRPCETCGRGVSFGGWRRSRLVLCSRDCGRERRNRRRRVEHDVHICSVCEEEFTPSRADAVYCCDACRQFSYRMRKQERRGTAAAKMLV